MTQKGVSFGNYDLVTQILSQKLRSYMLKGVSKSKYAYVLSKIYKNRITKTDVGEQKKNEGNAARLLKGKDTVMFSSKLAENLWSSGVQ